MSAPCPGPISRTNSPASAGKSPAMAVAVSTSKKFCPNLRRRALSIVPKIDFFRCLFIRCLFGGAKNGMLIMRNLSFCAIYCTFRLTFSTISCIFTKECAIFCVI